MLKTASACVLLLAAGAATQARAEDDGTTPFVVTPDVVVDRMLRLAEPKAGDYLIDLGSGDGRIVIEAAKRFGTRGLGVDIDPRLVRLARANAQRAGVADLARFEVQDLFETDLAQAAVVTMYLLPDVNLKLRPRLISMLRPGARIVSHDYDLGDWSPDESIELRSPDKTVGPVGRSRVMLWIVPADLRGTWNGEIPQHGGRWQFRVAQTHQLLDVSVHAGGRDLVVRGSGLRGNEIVLLATGAIGGRIWNHRFQGILSGDRIEGEVRVSDGEQTRRLPWSTSRTR